MISTVPSKRARLSELEQTQNQQSQQNLQQNLQQQQQQFRQMYNQSPNQHQNQQLIPGDFIQSPQMQQQQQITPQSEPLFTNHDVQLLQKGFDFLIETVVPHKSQQAKEVFANVIKSTVPVNTDNTVPQKNDSTNSIVLDVPILAESTQDESENVPSLLGQLLNHTYPSSMVELVEKLSKVSINPLDLSGNSTLSNVNNNSSTNNSPTTPTGTYSPTTHLSPPSKELCQQLIQEYFTHFNVIIPILDRRKFIDHWRNEGTTKHSKLLVTATLALAAARYSDDPSLQKTPDKPGGIFFDAAKKLLDSMYDTPRLETVQALLLLVHSETTLSRISSAFMFLGMAVQMAHALHLERSESTNLLPEEDEERRRVFYCIYCCDRWISFVLGKPYLIDDININVPLPTLPSFERPARNFFVSFIKLSRIIGQIWRFGYSSQPKAAQSTWSDHVSNQKSMLRQIRAALAKWLKELPDDLQYQYLPNTDIRSLFQLARFSVYAGFINIMFHTCIILLHQPYLAQAYDNPKIEANQGPIKTCLTAATTITDIAKTTRHFDKKALCSFQYPIYGILQSAIMEMVIMNGSADHAQDAKKALNDTIEELRWAAENARYNHLKETVKELEAIMMITNGNSGGNHLSIPLPLVIQMLEQNNNNNTQKSSPATNDNNATSNPTSKYSNDDFMNDSMKPECPNDSSTILNTESNSTVTAQQNLPSKSPNISHLQNQRQLHQQQIQSQQNMFMIPTTTSLNQQFSSYDVNNHNDNDQQLFYMDDFLFDNVNTTNTGVATSHNQVIDDLSSIYSSFDTYPENNSHVGSQ